MDKDRDHVPIHKRFSIMRLFRRRSSSDIKEKERRESSGGTTSVNSHQPRQNRRSRFFGGGGARHGNGGDRADRDFERGLPRPTQASAGLVAQLPEQVLKRIFIYLCPHSQDESYDPCEQSYTRHVCMLCGLRDLAHCVQTCKAWARYGRPLMYKSIRIDAVHYCPLEAMLSDKRKRTSRFEHNGIPEDASKKRLQLLCRTLREDPTRLGHLVEYFKPHQTLREYARGHLAEAIAVMPNLRYIDLPKGFLTDDGCRLLRLEVQARCRHLRKMTFRAGSQDSLRKVVEGQAWPELEVVDLIGVELDHVRMRYLLGAMPRLKALRVENSEAFGDDVFGDEVLALAASEGGVLDQLPPLREVILGRTPNLTDRGIAAMLRQMAGPTGQQHSLRQMTLWKTGVNPGKLQNILEVTPRLTKLTVTGYVRRALPVGRAGEDHSANRGVRSLVSDSLRTLHFEICVDKSESPYSLASKSYYAFLASSILAGGLPQLRTLFVRDAHFSDYLQGGPPSSPLPTGQANLPRRPVPSSTRPDLLSPQTAAFPSLPIRQAPPDASGDESGDMGIGIGGRGGLVSPSTTSDVRLGSNNPFATDATVGGAIKTPTHKLVIYTKADDEEEERGWAATTWTHPRDILDSDAAQRLRGPALGVGIVGERPRSSYGLGGDVSGKGFDVFSATKNVLVGNSTGGYVPVPTYGPTSGGRALRLPQQQQQEHGQGSGDDTWSRPKSSGV